jgi:hypothetical protein
MITKPRKGRPCPGIGLKCHKGEKVFTVVAKRGRNMKGSILNDREYLRK